MTYYRIQPSGRTLIGHTSEGSDSPLPSGFVFAYSSPREIVGEWFGVCLPARAEVVTFEGTGEYDPGDAEGVAVRPTREVGRTTLRRWLRAQMTADPEHATEYQDALDRIRGR